MNALNCITEREHASNAIHHTVLLDKNAEELLDKGLEKITLDGVVTIKPDQIEVYINKDITFEGIIACSGTLLFKDCIIRYSGTAESKIVMESEESSISFDGCYINCTSQSDDKLGFVECKSSCDNVAISECFLLRANMFLNMQVSQYLIVIKNKFVDCYAPINVHAKTCFISNNYVKDTIATFLDMTGANKGAFAACNNYFDGQTLLDDYDVPLIRVNDTSFNALEKCTFSNIHHVIDNISSNGAEVKMERCNFVGCYEEIVSCTH